MNQPKGRTTEHYQRGVCKKGPPTTLVICIRLKPSPTLPYGLEAKETTPYKFWLQSSNHDSSPSDCFPWPRKDPSFPFVSFSSFPAYAKGGGIGFNRLAQKPSPLKFSGAIPGGFFVYFEGFDVSFFRRIVQQYVQKIPDSHMSAPCTMNYMIPPRDLPHPERHGEKMGWRPIPQSGLWASLSYRPFRASRSILSTTKSTMSSFFFTPLYRGFWRKPVRSLCVVNMDLDRSCLFLLVLSFDIATI